LGRLLRTREQRLCFIAEEQGDSSVGCANFINAGPTHFTGRAKGIQKPRCVVGDSSGKDIGFDYGSGQRATLQLSEGRKQSILTIVGFRKSLPMQEKAAVARRVDGFDFFAQTSERALTKRSENIGVTEFVAVPVGKKSAAKDLRGFEGVAQGLFD
jgi:hypothetical protein